MLLALLGASLLAVSPGAPPIPAPFYTPATTDQEPWRLGNALGVPDWLEIGGFQRTRFETFDEQFRAGGSGHQQLVVLRSLLWARASYDRYEVMLELMDSRQFDNTEGGPLNTGIVNALEVLQAYAGARYDNVFTDGDELNVIAGRHTMNVGSRRLIARNRFRNTINAFTGVNATWKSSAGSHARAFLVAPVRRLPRGASDLNDNDIQLDEERGSVRFYGIEGSTPDLVAGAEGQAYFLGLDEADASELSTRNRELLTIGGRLRRKPEPGTFDFEWESAFQFGKSRASTSASDTNNLDHRAQFHHVGVGYQFDAPGELRVEGVFDFASGDRDPNDDENNRFDTLFGARRFEFGPTGIFGAFARANLISPGYRLYFKPHAEWQVMLAHRLHLLASDRDAWTTSGLVDPSGATSRTIGQLAEIRLRHEIVPKNVGLEFGVAHLFAGSFIDDAPNATTQGDTTYAYVATTLTF